MSEGWLSTNMWRSRDHTEDGLRAGGSGESGHRTAAAVPDPEASAVPDPDEADVHAAGNQDGSGTAADTVNTNYGDAETVVQAATFNGGVHSTKNNIEKQYISFFYAAEWYEAGRFGARYVDFVRKTFVPADHDRYERFVADLDNTGFGAVTGSPGTGRRSAAIVALARLGLPIRPVQVEEDEDWSLNKLVCDSGNGYLIDLTGSRKLSASQAQSLHDYAVRAGKRGSAVVVVMRGAQRPDDGIAGVTELPATAPSGTAVFRRHLSVLLPDTDIRPWQSDQRVMSALADAVPASAARLAGLAYEAHRSGTSAEVEEWISSVLAAHRNWHTQLADWFADHGSDNPVYDRVLLAAVAMLEGAPADEVLIAASRLAEEIGVAPADPTGISGPGLEATLKVVGAKITPERTALFSELAYAPAVLDYLWREHPRIREPLLDWSIQVPTGLSRAWPELVSRHWLELAERHDDFTWVTRLFLAWVRLPLTAPVAIGMAGRVAALPREGRDMRSALYSIAKKPRDSAIAIAAAQVCGVYGTAAPATALTRLKWLADQDDDKIRGEVRQTLVTLAESPEIRLQMLRELIDWIDDPQGRGRSAVAPEVISHLLTIRNPAGLPAVLADSMSAEQRSGHAIVAQAWRRLLVPRHTPLAENAVAAWLDPLVTGRVDFETVAQVMSTAAQGSLPRVVAASKLVDYWLARPGGADAGNTAVILRLYEHIHAADPLAADDGDNGQEQL